MVWRMLSIGSIGSVVTRNLAAISCTDSRVAWFRGIMDAAYPVQCVIIVCAWHSGCRWIVRVAIGVFPMARVVSPVFSAAGGHSMAAELVKMAGIVAERFVAAIGIIDPGHPVIPGSRVNVVV